jgi:hypothetical protein
MAKKQLTVHLEPATFALLQERGAAGERGPSEVVRRRLEILDSLIVHCDPRFTRGFPDQLFDFVVSYLEAPWAIPPDRILGLESYMAQKPGFNEAARAAGVDPAEVRRAIQELTFAERLALLDAAEVHHTQALASHPRR